MQESMKVSGSMLPRIALCPGSLRAQDGLPDKGDSEAAASGRRVHAVLEKIITEEAFDSVEYISDRVRDGQFDLTEREEFVAGWFANIVQESVTLRGGLTTSPAIKDAIVKESQCNIKIGGLVGTPVEIGTTPDLIVYTRNGADVFEYKTGRASVATSEANLQGQLYAYRAVMVLPTGQNVRLHVLSAGNEKGENHTWSDYSVQQLGQCAAAIGGMVRAALEKNAKRIPSAEACKYCRAAGTERCPESSNVALKLCNNAVELKIDKATSALRKLSPEQAARTLDAIEQAETIFKGMKATAKEMLQADQAAITGWRVGEASQVRGIPDTRKAIRALMEAGIDREAVLAATTLSLKGAAEAWYADAVSVALANGAKKPTKTAAAEAVGKLLDAAGCVATTERAGSLERV